MSKIICRSVSEVCAEIRRQADELFHRNALVSKYTEGYREGLLSALELLESAKISEYPRCEFRDAADAMADDEREHRHRTRFVGERQGRGGHPSPGGCEH